MKCRKRNACRKCVGDESRTWSTVVQEACVAKSRREFARELPTGKCFIPANAERTPPETAKVQTIHLN